ncbi:L-type lectin-domain containing receptor kinase IX.1-like [Cryptomeria japonica]|uniref:L-type lectin-domain containing receptor kinase IX.1-like n=1 Tax=Cryptomeria japonica TaxID=3369 RepID=UPI0025AC6ACE|nr:L-type lectin-domain containing receptor kinase IX.1-like [Cryptomeria japonica]
MTDQFPARRTEGSVSNSRAMGQFDQVGGGPFYDSSSTSKLTFASNSFIHGTDAEAIAFNFPPQINMTAIGDASISHNEIRFTKTQLNSSLNSSLGWAIYNDLIPLWDGFSEAEANFSTHFQFVISKPSDKRATGAGLAFFLANSGMNIENPSPGEYLGLFKNTTDGNTSNQIVAVEFVTSKETDIDSSDEIDVGIDVNRIKSKKNVSLYGLSGNIGKWDAWVGYDGTVNRLQVFLLFNPNGTDASKPANPFHWDDIDLRQHLPENVIVGFSASTGSGYAIELHTVRVSNFSCQYSWEIQTDAIAPAPETRTPGQGHTRKENSSAKIILSDEEFNKSLREAAQSALEFSYAELCVATNNFSDDKKIGLGGFGFVYRGTLLSTNEAVAIKRVSPSSKQGKREYLTEICINSKLNHHNLVKFLGWSHRKGDLLLVYELLPNGSLDKHIFENPETPLDWDRRYSIACDVGSSLVYLHEDRHESVVHRDIKASNVMLDSNFKAKLGDFGLARMVEREKVGHTTTPAGTIGYMAPEFVTTGKATREIDVFSFGALSLEIACGKRPADWSLIEHNCRVVECVWHLHEQHRILDAADEKLDRNFNVAEMERLLKVRLLCSHPDPNARPSMQKVVGILKRGAELPHVPLKFPVAVYSDRISLNALPSSSSSSTSTEVGGSMVFPTYFAPSEPRSDSD